MAPTQEETHPRRWLSALIILAIGFIFAVQWGPGSRGCDSPVGAGKDTSAARVNGKEIPLRQFQLQYAMTMQRMEGQGRRIPPELAQQLGLPKEVLDQLITSELLSQAALERGVVPSQAELRKVIQENPGFQKEGKFDFQRYQEFVQNYYRKSVGEYEAELEREMAAQKLLEIVRAAAVVSEDELQAKFQRDGNKAQVTFARFLPSMYADKVPAPSDADVKQYEGAHAKELSDYFAANRAGYPGKELEDVKGEIAATLLKKDRAKELARADAQKALKALLAGTELAAQFPPEKENKPAALRFETETRPEAVPTGDFNAGAQSVPYLGPSPDVLAAVFAATAPRPLDKVFEVGDGFAVVQVTQRALPQDAEFAKKKDELRDQALRGKQMELRESFIKALRKNARIVTNPDALGQAVGRAG